MCFIRHAVVLELMCSVLSKCVSDKLTEVLDNLEVVESSFKFFNVLMEELQLPSSLWRHLSPQLGNDTLGNTEDSLRGCSRVKKQC